MRIFAGEWVKNILTRLGMQEGEAIESRMVSRRIEGAQKKVEERNFEIRKNLLEYDEVMDEQRKRVYGYRQAILDGVNCRDLILDMIRDQIDERLPRFLDPNYGIDIVRRGRRQVAARRGARRPRTSATRRYEEAERIAHDEAERMAESKVLDAIDENLPEDAEEEWNWEALAKWANLRCGVQPPRPRPQEDRPRHARRAAGRCGPQGAGRGRPVRDGPVPRPGLRRAIRPRAWLLDKFGIELSDEEVKEAEPAQIVAIAHQRAEEAYDHRESEYAIMAAFNRFRQGGQKGTLDREGLVEWANRRFHADLTLDDFKNKQGEEIAKLLIDHSEKANEKANAVVKEAQAKVDKLFAGDQHAVIRHARQRQRHERQAGRPGRVAQGEHRRGVLDRRPGQPRPRRRATQGRRRRSRISSAPRCAAWSGPCSLQLLDSAWKEHLLAMDHLRSSVGLRGYAQVDPKVEYKREGMAMFERMWDSLGAYVTDLVFKMETLDEGFVSSTWVETEARHDEGPSATDIARQQQAAIDASEQSGRKLEPIRNQEEKVGRNSPCPCGSGKKYKQCCGRASGGG